MPLTTSQEMLDAAGRSRAYLGPDTERVGSFLLSRREPCGGFRGRGGNIDLYYTAFAIDAIAAAGRDFDADPTRQYVRNFNDGDGLDFVHLVCLGRCLARLFPGDVVAQKRAGILARIEGYRSQDDGYNVKRGAKNTSAYACLLASMLYEDLGAELPRLRAMGMSLRGLETGDHGFANEKGMRRGTVTATAAAVSFLRRFGAGNVDKAAGWLMAQHCETGGFTGTPGAPFPDLLSTATALYALSKAGVPLDSIRRPCLDFIETLMGDNGGFCGHEADVIPDCEYTYYGLLAIGSLAA